MKKSQHGVKLTESMDYSTATADAEAGIVRGIRIIGPSSPSHHRRYTESALRGAVGLYEGARVNANHMKTLGDRQVEDRFGKLLNVRSDSKGGIVGDLHFFRTHPMASRLVEAVGRPELHDTMGLSHQANGRTRNEGGTQIVEQIVKVLSVDLVADPATNKSLFECEENMDMAVEGDPAAGGADMTKQMFLQMAGEVIDGEGDGASKAAKINKLAKVLLKLADQLDGAMADPAAADAAPPEENNPMPESQKAEVGKLQETVAQQAAQLDAYKRLTESRRVANPLWVAAVAAAPAESRAALIESLPVQPLAESARSASPKPQETETKPATNAKEFAAAIRG